MGNYMSCAQAAKAPGRGHSHGGGKCARVILPDGGVRQVPLPATAAELMMDAPGHFLSFLADDSPELGSRLAALPADEKLQPGAVYAAFPMKRKGTPLAAADVARLAAAAAAAATATREAARRSAKVANAVVVVAPPDAALDAEKVAEDAPPCRLLRLEEMVDDAAAAEICELKHRASNARSRRPTLETIEEETYMSSRYVTRH